MSTSRSTDMGTWTLVETGEPTVDNPTVWYSRDAQWKPGTPQAKKLQALPQLQQLLVNLAPGLQQGQADVSAWPTADQATRDQIIVRLLNQTMALANGVSYLITHLGLNPDGS